LRSGGQADARQADDGFPPGGLLDWGIPRSLGWFYGQMIDLAIIVKAL
jgi:hypothetical protein